MEARSKLKRDKKGTVKTRIGDAVILLAGLGVLVLLLRSVYRFALPLIQ
ncbi:hypothetical protein METH_09525 [Leisingera methylohalidivorans DSM 14336]|uniref:Uncharacterized protein n=1 Tax=Leisingera methylohalidivorans DSM 14336 TaxID=999552 RepID=V9W075_9RHOB|nr:hypothetical protein METH_09525 [Leisingera methylohalidivorans DSM 14336]